MTAPASRYPSICLRGKNPAMCVWAFWRRSMKGMSADVAGRMTSEQRGSGMMAVGAWFMAKLRKQRKDAKSAKREQRKERVRTGGCRMKDETGAPRARCLPG